MEWIWYIIAALGAGVGTGLAGLSAATATELYSPGEWDAVTVFAALLIALLLLTN